jgi:hypothetical protein
MLVHERVEIYRHGAQVFARGICRALASGSAQPGNGDLFLRAFIMPMSQREVATRLSSQRVGRLVQVCRELTVIGQIRNDGTVIVPHLATYRRLSYLAT